jgi:PAS domain S-box-containing protein
MKLWQKMALLMIVPLLLEVGFIIAVMKGQNELNLAYAAERKSQDTIILIHRALKCSLDPLTYLMNYRNTGSSGSDLERQRASESLDELRRLSKRIKIAETTPNQFASILQTMHTLEESLDEAVHSKGLHEPHMTNPMDFMRITKLGRDIISLTQRDMDAADVAHELKIREVTEKQAKFDALLMTAVLVSGTFALALVFVFAASIRKQLSILMTNSENLALGKALMTPMRGTDELSMLDRCFHRMAKSMSELTERERATLKNSGELIFAIDSKLRFSFVNDAVTKILGFSTDEFLGQHAANILSPCIDKIEMARNLEEDQTFEAELRHKSGNPVELQISAAWSAVEQSYFCVAHDIGARKEMERLKQSFMQMVSHDLRTPISANLMTLDLLKTDPSIGTLSERGISLIDRTIGSNSRLIAMVNDLLEIERLDAGKVEIDKELVSFNDLVEEALRSVEMLAKTKGIQIRHQDSDRLIYCNNDRMVQVLVNLLGNAIKFSPVNVPIEIDYAESERTTSIFVKDNGPGIAEEDLKRLFERFQQVRDNNGVHKQGFGLGLEICKKLVELHDGSIVVTSEIGKGTCFEVQLPKAE